MVGTALSLIFSGSVALLAGGGAHAVTRTHYQRRIRALEARLRELRRALQACETELAEALAEAERLRAEMRRRDQRLEELAGSIAALRDLLVTLTQQSDAHERFTRRALAALTFSLGRHREEGEEMRRRSVETRHTLDLFADEETQIQAAIIELRRELSAQEQTVATAEAKVEETLGQEQSCAAEIQAAVSG